MDSKELQASLKVRPVPGGSPDNTLIEVMEGIPSIRFKMGKLAQINQIFFAPGKVTGNHYHESKEEVFAVTRGVIEVYLYDASSAAFYSQLVDERKMFTLEPGLVHALYNPTAQETILIELSNKRFSKLHPRDDVFMYPIVGLNGTLLR